MAVGLVLLILCLSELGIHLEAVLQQRAFGQIRGNSVHVASRQYSAARFSRLNAGSVPSTVEDSNSVHFHVFYAVQTAQLGRGAVAVVDVFSVVVDAVVAAAADAAAADDDDVDK